MSDANESAPSQDAEAESRAWERLLDVEALAQMVEEMGQNKDLSQRIGAAVTSIRRQLSRQSDTVEALQGELRSALLDIELLKRASSSSGHMGVLARDRVGHELTRAVLPPHAPRDGLGLRVNRQPHTAKRVDCASRLHLCKAACCRIFQVSLTPTEVDSGRYEWDAHHPYALPRVREGCQYLRAGGCECRIYDHRPATCVGYDCSQDKRIWKDFERFELEPSLAQRLETLRVELPAGVPSSHVHGAQPAAEIVPAAATPKVANTTQQTVAPPDFTELKRRMQHSPEQVFVPPKRSSNGAAAAAPVDGNSEQRDDQ